MISLIFFFLTFPLFICKSRKMSLNSITAFTVFLTVSITPCFAGDTHALSENEKERVHSALYFLIEAEEEIKRKKEKEQKKQLKLKKAQENLALAVMLEADEKTEEADEKPAVDAMQETYGKTKDPTWETVFNERNNSYVQTLFENDINLQEWIKRSPEVLFNAIQSENLEMLQFFVEKGAAINVARESALFSPLHYAIITRKKLGIITFLLDHPKINLRQTNVWGDNIFHIIFLGGVSGQTSKYRILQLLFQEKYFSKISDLLNTPNNHKETALDFAWKDESNRSPNRISLHPNRESLLLLEEKDALTFSNLSESHRRFFEEKIERSVCATEFL